MIDVMIWSTIDFETTSDIGFGVSVPVSVSVVFGSVVEAEAAGDDIATVDSFDGNVAVVVAEASNVAAAVAKSVASVNANATVKILAMPVVMTS